MEKLKIVSIPIDKVKEYGNNAKIHGRDQIEQIKKSITEFGNCDPISLDDEYVIIEGHGRVQAMRELGFTDVQAIVLSHLTEGQKAAYRLVHNKLTMDTGFDLSALEIELNNIIELDIGTLTMDDFGLKIEDRMDGVIDELLDDALGVESGHKADSDIFSITFSFPVEKRDMVTTMLKEKGKDYITEMILKEAEVYGY